MVSCLTCDHKVGGSIPCQAKTTLLIGFKIVLFLPFRAAVVKNSKSEAAFIKTKLYCYVKLRHQADFR